MGERLPIGTLVRMTGTTNMKTRMVKEHGYLWTVQDYDPSRERRIYVLKSLATGHIENFNIYGLEAPDKEHDDGASDTAIRSY